jgi:hypothetical protein
VLDKLTDNGALVHETTVALIVSELSAPATREAAKAFAVQSWQYVLRDSADTETELGDVTDEFGPYRITANKPEDAISRHLILTASGFRDWLSNEVDPVAMAVTVVGLNHEFSTETTRFLPAEIEYNGKSQTPWLRSPRTLVREYTSERIVPKSIGRWLLISSECSEPQDAHFRLWAEFAIRSLVLSLPNEIDQDSGAVVFKGPPRVSLAPPGTDGTSLTSLGNVSFRDLQAAVKWVYELDREAETRHTLFACEFARTGDRHVGTMDYLRANVGVALEGAKIAHQMAVAKVSADNLKALADLRKAVTDETAKLTDATRQVVAAVAAALSVGLALIAARVTANAPAWLVISVMVVVCAYIFAVIYSGYSFARIQRNLRDVWRNQIYKFLPTGEYDRLVVNPGNDAERILKVVSWVGGTTVTVILIVTLAASSVPIHEWISLQRDSAAPTESAISAIPRDGTAPDVSRQLTLPTDSTTRPSNTNNEEKNP